MRVYKEQSIIQSSHGRDMKNRALVVVLLVKEEDRRWDKRYCFSTGWPAERRVANTTF